MDNFVTFTATITQCVDCRFCKEIPDPDPYDWFCDDDVALVCTHTNAGINERYNPESVYAYQRQNLPVITVSCRPHHTRKESDIPNWCPLLKNE